MNDRRSSLPIPALAWFQDPDGAVVRRATGIAVTWAYLAGVAALVMVALAALVALAVVAIVYLVDFADRQLEFDAVRAPTVFLAWIVVPIAAAVSIWSAAYGSTRAQSVPRGAAGVGIAFVAAMFLWGIESSALVMLTLAAGWTAAIPVEHPGRWGTRIALPLIALIIYPSWPGMSVADLTLWLGTGPLVAAGLVLLGDLGWDGVRLLRTRGEAELVARSPSTEDV